MTERPEIAGAIEPPADPERIELGDVRELNGTEPPMLAIPVRSECSGDLVFVETSGPIENWRPELLLPEAELAKPEDLRPGGKYEGWDVVLSDHSGVRLMVRPADALDNVEISAQNAHLVVPRDRYTAAELHERTTLLLRRGQKVPDMLSHLSDEERRELLLAGQRDLNERGRQFNIWRADADRLGITYDVGDRFLDDLSAEQREAFGIKQPEVSG